MGVIEHFDRMPLGVKLLFILIFLGIPGSISALVTYAFIPFATVYEYVLGIFIASSGVLITFLQIHGLWNGKKFMEKLYIFMIIFALFNLLIVPLIFPNFFKTVINFSLTNSDKELSQNQIQKILPLTSLFFYAIYIWAIIFYLILIWYVRKRKDYFVN